MYDILDTVQGMPHQINFDWKTVYYTFLDILKQDTRILIRMNKNLSFNRYVKYYYWRSFMIFQESEGCTRNIYILYKSKLQRSLKGFPSRWYLNLVLPPRRDKLWSNYRAFVLFPTKNASSYKKCCWISARTRTHAPRWIYCSANSMCNTSKEINVNRLEANEIWDIANVINWTT